MKLDYDREEDILTIEIVPDEVIDNAEQVGPFIAHFSPTNRLVLLEVLDASEFLAQVIPLALRRDSQETPLPVQQQGAG
jgi:hypothetical protein